MDKKGYPNWTEGNPEWAFNKDTVSQLSGIAAQLENMKFNVQSRIIFNNEDKIKNEGPNLTCQEYQDCMNGLAIVAEEPEEQFKKKGYGKKIVIETSADDDSIFVQAGFQPEKMDLWNNGIYYNQRFSKDELGKFSNLWDRIVTVFLNNTIVPIQSNITPSENTRVVSGPDAYLNGFIKEGLKNGYIKKLRNNT